MSGRDGRMSGWMGKFGNAKIRIPSGRFYYQSNEKQDFQLGGGGKLIAGEKGEGVK